MGASGQAGQLVLHPRRFVGMLWLGLALASAASGQVLDEYEMKGAFLYNFAKFVEWPADTFKSPTDPIVGCILAERPFAQALERSVHGRSIGERIFAIRQIADPHEAAGCQILFVASSERRRPRAIFKEVAVAGVLTVGEADGFLSDGGVANLRLEGGRIRIQINVQAAEKQKLRISPKLLSLAQIVRN